MCKWCFLPPLVSMEEGAAERCKEAIEKALHYDQNNPEALQLMASYLFSIEKPEVRHHLCTRNHPVFFVVFSHTAHEAFGLIHSTGGFKDEPNPSSVQLNFCTFFSSVHFDRFIIMSLLRLEQKQEGGGGVDYAVYKQPEHLRKLIVKDRKICMERTCCTLIKCASITNFLFPEVKILHCNSDFNH